jgi:hypothetical protein
MFRIFTRKITSYIKKKTPNIKHCMKNCQCITCWRYQSFTPLIDRDELQEEYEKNINFPPVKKNCNCNCVWCGWPQNINPL